MPRILKADTNGIIEVAISDIDYASVATEEEIAAEAEESVIAAQAAATSALSSAGLAAEGAIAATNAAVAAEGFAVAAGLSEDTASAASTLASLAVIALRLVEFLDGNINAEIIVRAGKVTYYAGRASAYAEKATEAVKSAGFGIINNKIPSIPGAAGASGKTTLLINANIDINGGNIENISQSPGNDYDAVSLRFFWDLFNDNVEIIWQ